MAGWAAGRWLGVILLLGSAACAEPAALADQRRRLDADGQQLLADLERVETRLLAAQAVQREWSELQERHQKVSAIACENVAEHVAAMELHDRRQQEKRARLRRRQLIEAQVEKPHQQRVASSGGGTAASN